MSTAYNHPDSPKASPTQDTELAGHQVIAIHNTPSVPDHELIRSIGQGAYGQIWLGRNVMGTYRAIKIVYRSNFSEHRPYEREFDGIKAFEPISRTHTELIDILQVGRNDAAGYFYYIMELADDRFSGQKIDPESYAPRTLDAEIARRGRLPWEECLELSLSLCGGLAHLHQNGLIHRDIKPSNIVFIHGIPKIADIGLVAEVGPSRSLVGTPGFIPPEGPGTVQADIYSLGKVFYEILSGRDRQDFPHLATDLRADDRNQGYFELHQVVLKACETDVRERYPSVDALRSDLRLLQAGKSVRRLRILERRLRLVSRGGGVVAALLLLCAAAYYHVSQQRTLATSNLAGSYVAYGTQLADRRDLFGALPSFASALQLSGDRHPAAEGHRIRMGVVLRECPKLTQSYFTTGQVNSVEFSPNGTQLLTGGGQEGAIVWDVQSAKPLLIIGIPGSTGHLETASYSPDGSRIITTGNDQTARIWDARTGTEQPGVSPILHDAPLMSARFSPDGNRIVTTCIDGSVRIWQLGSSEPLAAFQAHDAAARYAIYDPDGNRLVTCGEDRTAKLWPLNSDGLPEGNPIVWPHANWVYQAAFSPDDRLVVTASYDGKARVFDAHTGDLRTTLDPKAPVRAVKISPDGRFVVTAGWDFYLSTRLWDLSSGQEAFFPFRSTAYATDICFSPDGRQVAIAAANGVVSQWDLSGNAWQPLPAAQIYGTDGRGFATVQPDSVVVTADSNAPSVAIDLPPNTQLQFAKLGSNGQTLLTVIQEKPNTQNPTHLAQLWNARQGKPLAPPFPLNAPVTTAAFSRSGGQLVLAANTIASLWHVASNQPPLIFPHESAIAGANLSSSGERLITWAGTNALLWNAITRKQIAILPHISPVGHAEFSPNDRYLVTCCILGDLQKRYAELWDAETGAPLGIRLWHRDGVRHASFSADSRRLITASEDRSARIWETESGRAVTEPMVHRHQVMQGVFSPDGRWAATRCFDETVRVWDARSGTPVTHRLENTFRPRHIQFIDGGTHLLVSNAAGNRWSRTDDPPARRLWNLVPDARPIDDLIVLSQLLSGRRGDQIGGGLVLEREDLQSGWTKLRAAYAQDFTVSPAEVIAWHWREANASQAARNPQAAQFHLNRLLAHLTQVIATDPANHTLLERRTLAEQKLRNLPTAH